MSEPPQIEVVESSESNVMFAAGRLTIEIEIKSDKMSIDVTDANDANKFVTVDRDFFGSRQKRNTVANDMAKGLSESAETIKTVFADINEAIEKMEMKMVSDDARSLLDRTESVNAYQTASETTIEVMVSPPADSLVNSSRTMVFDAQDFAADDPTNVESAHYQEFLTDISLSSDDWEMVSELWNEIMTLERSESVSEDDRIARRMTNLLESVIDVFDDPNALEWDSEAGYWDDGDVLVRSSLIQNLVDDSTSKSGAAYAGELANTLQKQDVMTGESNRVRSNGKRVSVWPIDAAALTLTEDDVKEFDDESIEVNLDGGDDE